MKTNPSKSAKGEVVRERLSGPHGECFKKEQWERSQDESQNASPNKAIRDFSAETLFVCSLCIDSNSAYMSENYSNASKGVVLELLTSSLRCNCCGVKGLELTRERGRMFLNYVTYNDEPSRYNPYKDDPDKMQLIDLAFRKRKSNNGQDFIKENEVRCLLPVKNIVDMDNDLGFSKEIETVWIGGKEKKYLYQQHIEKYLSAVHFGLDFYNNTREEKEMFFKLLERDKFKLVRLIDSDGKEKLHKDLYELYCTPHLSF